MVIVNKSRIRLHIDEYHFQKLYFPSILILKEHFYVYDVWGAQGLGRRAVSLQATTRLFNIELPKIFLCQLITYRILTLMLSLWSHSSRESITRLVISEIAVSSLDLSIYHSFNPFSLQTSFVQLHLPTMDHGLKTFGIKMLEELAQGAKMD